LIPITLRRLLCPQTDTGGYAVHPSYDQKFLIPGIFLNSDLESVRSFFGQKSYSLQPMSSTPSSLQFSYEPNLLSDSQSYKYNGQKISNYPFNIGNWVYYEKLHATPIEFFVSKNGIVNKDNITAPNSRLTDVVGTYTVNRYSFDFDEASPSNYVINYVDVVPLNNEDNSFEVWLDRNSVKPYFTISQDDDLRIPNVKSIPDSAHVEYYRESEKNSYIPDVIVRARLKNTGNKNLESEIHNGWYYLDNEEYYVYSNPVTEYLTYSNTPNYFIDSTPCFELNLSDVARQGAPIIIKSTDKPETNLVQIAFQNEATPSMFSFTNTETIKGGISNNIFLGYRNVYDVSVFDPVSNSFVVKNKSSNTEKVSVLDSATPVILSEGREYKVQYKVRNSYTVTNENYDENNELYTKIVFDATPTTGAKNYSVTYESSIFNFSTPSGVYHSPNISLLPDGFLFLTDKVYDYSGFFAQANPSFLLDDSSKDYSIISLESFDINNNPKPNQSYKLVYDNQYLTATPDQFTTNDEGFAYSKVKYIGATPATVNSVPLYIYNFNNNQMNYADAATVSYDIFQSSKSLDKLFAEVEPYSRVVKANGDLANPDKITINGVIQSPTKSIAGVKVYYRLSRTLNQALSTPGYSVATTDNNGIFKVGPITAQTSASPGYWFMVLETEYSQTLNSKPVTIAGDVVHWYEDAVDSLIETRNKINSIQETFVADQFISYDSTPVFKVDYVTGEPIGSSATPTIDLPQWFALPRWTQYQFGILGSDYYKSDNQRKVYPS